MNCDLIIYHLLVLIFLPSVCWMSCAVEHLKGSAFYTLMQLSPFLRCFPYCRSPLQGNPRQPRSGGQLDAIDFVTIAIPSLRSLRSRHNLHHFSYYATSPAWQLRNKTPRILVLYVKSDARFARRRCGSCHVFETAQSVNKYAPN